MSRHERARREAGADEHMRRFCKQSGGGGSWRQIGALSLQMNCVMKAIVENVPSLM